MENKKDPVFEEWLLTRPEVIQKLAKKYPPNTRYIIKDGSPYAVSCDGTKVDLYSYHEDGNVSVVIMPEDKLQEAKDHEMMLGIKFGKSEEEMAEYAKNPTVVCIDPQWLIPIIDIE